MGEQTHPFVNLSLRPRLYGGSGIAHDETELSVEPVSDLVGLLDVIRHGKDEERWGKLRTSWLIRRETTLEYDDLLGQREKKRR